LVSTQQAFDLFLDDDVDDAGLLVVQVVVRVVVTDAHLLVVREMVTHHPSRWHCHTVHDFGANKLQHTIGLLDHACFRNDCLSQIQVRGVYLHMTKTCQVSAKSRQHLQQRLHKHAVGRQRMLELTHICKLDCFSQELINQFGLWTHSAHSSITGSQLTSPWLKMYVFHRELEVFVLRLRP